MFAYTYYICVCVLVAVFVSLYMYVCLCPARARVYFLLLGKGLLFLNRVEHACHQRLHQSSLYTNILHIQHGKPFAFSLNISHIRMLALKTTKVNSQMI